MAGHTDKYDLRLLDMQQDVLPPEAVTIGIPQAEEQERSLQCLLHVIWYKNEQYGMYVCDGKTNTGLPGEQIFILGHGQYWYACEGKVVAGKLKIRQSCFRTQDAFYKTGDHTWQTNLSRHVEAADGGLNEDGWHGDWKGPEARFSTQVDIL